MILREGAAHVRIALGRIHQDDGNIATRKAALNLEIVIGQAFDRFESCKVPVEVSTDSRKSTPDVETVPVDEHRSHRAIRRNIVLT